MAGFGAAVNSTAPNRYKHIVEGAAVSCCIAKKLKLFCPQRKFWENYMESTALNAATAQI